VQNPLKRMQNTLKYIKLHQDKSKRKTD